MNNILKDEFRKEMKAKIEEEKIEKKRLEEERKRKEIEDAKEVNKTFEFDINSLFPPLKFKDIKIVSEDSPKMKEIKKKRKPHFERKQLNYS